MCKSTRTATARTHIEDSKIRRKTQFGKFGDSMAKKRPTIEERKYMSKVASTMDV